MKTRVLFAFACCILGVGFVGWRTYVHTHRSTPHFVVVADPSLSHLGSCESLLGLAEQSLRADGASQDSTLTVLVLGDTSTANEPWKMGQYSFPLTTKVLEGKSANTRRRDELLADIRRKCEAIRRTSVSPIFLGVKQAVADLHAHGCKAASHCRVFVDSDLEENAEPSIKNVLNRAHNTKHPLPTPLDNQGVEVSFCGLAVTAGPMANLPGKEIHRTLPRDQGRDDRLQQVWRSLFTNPELLRFEPYCPLSPNQKGTVGL
jgi:hypothetical protein